MQDEQLKYWNERTLQMCMKCRICPHFFFCHEKTLLFGTGSDSESSKKTNKIPQMVRNLARSYCFKLSATTWMIPAYSGNTLKGQCLRVLQVHTVPAQPSVQNSLQATSASSDPGTLDNNGPSHHIIYSPVVLEEQKCDERWEKEGDGKVLVQGSDSWSVEGDGGYNRHERGKLY